MSKCIALLAFLFISEFSMAGAISDHYFTSRDGIRLHYLEAGSGPQAIVFIPGWLMPAAVFRLQLESLGDDFRVLAFDPRSQGKSEIYQGQHDPARRMDDMEDFLSAAGVRDYVLAGWSLGVLESLDFIERKPQAALRGLILIDNSIGEGVVPAARSPKLIEYMSDPDRRKHYLTDFSRAIFSRQPPEDIADAVLSSVLQASGTVAIQLISQPYPRTYWRDIVTKQQVPVLYAIRPKFSEQAEALLRRKGALVQIEIFTDSGHALFVDKPKRFNSMTAAFARRCFISVSGPMPAPGAGAGRSESNASQIFSGN